jgi:hypothetical protein
MEGITFNYPPCLGTATWNYVTINQAASTNFKVCSVALNNVEPLNLLCSHEFFSKTLSTEENDKFISDLTAILTSINAKNITTRIRDDSPLVQSIFVNYEIDNVAQNKVDELTTTIASVCKKAIDDISIKYTCSTNEENEGDAEVATAPAPITNTCANNGNFQNTCISSASSCPSYCKCINFYSNYCMDFLFPGGCQANNYPTCCQDYPTCDT